jgi:hypothetical protein
MQQLGREVRELDIRPASSATAGAASQPGYLRNIPRPKNPNSARTTRTITMIQIVSMTVSLHDRRWRRSSPPQIGAWSARRSSVAGRWVGAAAMDGLFGPKQDPSGSRGSVSRAAPRRSRGSAGRPAEARAVLSEQDGLIPAAVVSESVHVVPQIRVVAALAPLRARSRRPRAISTAASPRSSAPIRRPRAWSRGVRQADARSVS